MIELTYSLVIEATEDECYRKYLILLNPFEIIVEQSKQFMLILFT